VVAALQLSGLVAPKRTCVQVWIRISEPWKQVNFRFHVKISDAPSGGIVDLGDQVEKMQTRYKSDRHSASNNEEPKQNLQKLH
jgi:hypothetical protein